MNYEAARIHRDLQRIHSLCLVIVSVVVLILIAIVGYIAIQETRYAHAMEYAEKAIQQIQRYPY